MAATLRVAQTAEDHLAGLSDGEASCKGDRHDFPKLRVGPLPQGVKAKHVRQGVYQLVYTCPDCGTERTRTTKRGGIVDSSIQYSYKYPPGYLAPKGAGLTRADYVDELAERCAPHVRAAANGTKTAKPRARAKR